MPDSAHEMFVYPENDKQKQERLTASLDCYVRPEDFSLPREMFLRRVVDRITDQLSALLPPTTEKAAEATAAAAAAAAHYEELQKHLDG